MARRLFLGGAVVIALGALLCILIPAVTLPLPETLTIPLTDSPKRQVRDRLGHPLSYTFASGWNTTDHTPLHLIPSLLQRACIEAEDRRFFEHSGIDWRARTHALWQNIRALRVIRGASTISEQVVRMLHPRPRSLWARILEGVEAVRLEQRFSKVEILEFYLNQVPFASNRRGVTQAARYFWDRDLDTLTEREQLALVVMMRAPEKLSIYRDPHRLDGRISNLAERLASIGAITPSSLTTILQESTDTRQEHLPIRADHFVRYVQSLSTGLPQGQPIHSTVDSAIQRSVQEILEARIRDLAPKHVTDGAVLVIDNRSASVLAWVNAGAMSEAPGSHIDAILTPRQPGSTLKPFLYALALAQGWTAATVINDAPIAEAVGVGLHSFRNYSRIHYGEIPLREALGNSLNIPAIRTIQYTGKEVFLDLLHKAGFFSLTKPAEFYGEGLALGNGEVTLLELVRGYVMLANRGLYRPLVFTRRQQPSEQGTPTRVLDAETSSIIGNILSDPYARRREFGSDGLLRFPVQTAIKTGTSSDYRDAWAIGYSDTFTIGVWMGNLDRSSMSLISGARGPALVLRSVFASLERTRDDRGLYLSPRLVHRAVCTATGKLASPLCPTAEELFTPGSEPLLSCDEKHSLPKDTPAQQHLHPSEPLARISLPTPGLRLAMDPRIPDSKEAFAFELTSEAPLQEVIWVVDGQPRHHTYGTESRYLWPLSSGSHVVTARVRPHASPNFVELAGVEFFVR